MTPRASRMMGIRMVAPAFFSLVEEGDEEERGVRMVALAFLSIGEEGERMM